MNTTVAYRWLTVCSWLVGPIATATPPVDILYVNANAKSGGNGSSWQSPYMDLQEALRAATPPAEIWVAHGTYYPDLGTGNTQMSFVLRNGIALLGGFAGDETSRMQRDPDANPTILSGDINPISGLGQSSENVVVGNFLDHSSILDGFIVESGHAQKFGGGLRLHHSSSIIQNCTFRNNSAYAGGGMFSWRCKGKIINCVFENNEAFVRGGGYYDVVGDADIRDCIFRNNTVITEGGGGYYGVAGEGLIKQSQFVGNKAPAGGGAGMYNFVGQVKIEGCSFDGNEGVFGAGFASNSGLPIIHSSTFKDNIASGDGGAFHIVNGFPQFGSCLFIGNEAARGAAMYSVRGMIELVNSTITDNIASAAGLFAAEEFGSVTLTNGIVWRNDATLFEGAGLFSATYSCVEGGATGEGNIAGDPRFYGKTYELGSDSPCIDAGNNSGILPEQFADLTGLRRFIDDPLTPDSGQGEMPVVDMGAHEFISAHPLQVVPPPKIVTGEPVTLEVQGAGAHQTIVLLYASELGATNYVGCPQLSIGLLDPDIFADVVADDSGEVRITGVFPEILAGARAYIQAVEPMSCRVSDTHLVMIE